MEIYVLTYLVAAAVIWFSGDRMTAYADILGKRTKVGGAAMGFLLLATVTQLPEIATNSTGALRNEPYLVLNSMVGGVVMQTAVLALADFAIGGKALTFVAEKSINLLQGVSLILLLSLVMLFLVIANVTPSLWSVGIGPVILLIAYVIVIYFLWTYRHRPAWQLSKPNVEEKEIELKEKQAEQAEEAKVLRAHEKKYHQTTTKQLWLYVLGCSCLILGAGVMLIISAEALAKQTNLGANFVGVTLLATATSLPELTTTIKAARIGAYTMAISDIFGSNLIMVLLLFPVDVLYRGGVILEHANQSIYLALIAGIVVTSIYLIGLVIRSKKTWLRLGCDSWAVIIVYFVSLSLFYQYR